VLRLVRLVGDGNAGKWLFVVRSCGKKAAFSVLNLAVRTVTTFPKKDQYELVQNPS